MAMVGRYSKSGLVPMLCVLSAVTFACSSPSAGKLQLPNNAGAGGSNGTAGSEGAGGPGVAGASSGVGGDTVVSGSGGSSDLDGNAGASAAGAGGSAGDATSGAGGDPTSIDGGITAEPYCVFHTDPPPVPEVDAAAPNEIDGAAPPSSDGGGSSFDAGMSDGAAGSGDGSTSTSDGGVPRDAAAVDGGASTTITVMNSPFVGNYLADRSGRTLYTYGGDMPGTCSDQPLALCERDCLISWPQFEGRPRTVPSSLGDGNFGTIQRADGSYQATYYGWPLYYYKTDTGPGVLGGQGKAKTWFVATVIPPSVVVMKTATAAKYLADGAGRTLYVFAQDTKGTSGSNPASACTGDCAATHHPFRKSSLSFVSPLEPTDFNIFVRGDGLGQQVAYKGAPLYYANTDTRSGDMTGTSTTDWTVVAQ